MIPEIEYYKLASKDLKKLREMIYEMEMTKSQNTKKEHHCIKQNEKSFIQKDLSLTELWKKGKLPEGHYYVKDGENMIAEYLDGYFYNNGEPMTSFSGGVDSVLEKVPSYKEWEKLNWYAGNGVEENQELKMENAQLKELLKEIIADADLSYCDSDIELRIDEVLK